MNKMYQNIFTYATLEKMPSVYRLKITKYRKNTENNKIINKYFQIIDKVVRYTKLIIKTKKLSLNNIDIELVYIKIDVSKKLAEVSTIMHKFIQLLIKKLSL